MSISKKDKMVKDLMPNESMPSWLRSVVPLTNLQVRKIMTKLCSLDRNDLELILAEQRENLLVLMIAKIMQRAIDSGNPKYLSFLLDRVIGKPVENVSAVEENDELLILDDRSMLNLAKRVRNGS